MKDHLMFLYVAVWRSNNWPILSTSDGTRMFIGLSKKSVKNELNKVAPALLKKVRIIKYVPVEYS